MDQLKRLYSLAPAYYKSVNFHDTLVQIIMSIHGVVILVLAVFRHKLVVELLLLTGLLMVQLVVR